MFHQLGVRHACISPGARNSPLTFAFTEHSEIQCFSHADERSSAFFALGLAKSTLKPVVLICTSGTAGANYFPAVIEASLGRVPIIILTADRPEYLVGTGANQTINQQNLFGIHVRYFFDVGLPEKDHKTLQKKIESAFNHSTGIEFKLPPGPVHLNFPFDEPLIPEKNEAIISPSITIKNMEKPEINFSIPTLEMAKNPIIIVGPMEGNTHEKELVQFGEKIQAPILADPLSQLRFGTENKIVLSNYDYFLRYKKINPDLVIRFGRKPTSKVLNQLLDKWKNNTILIDTWERFNDDCPQFIQSTIGRYCQYQIKNCSWQGEHGWQKQLLAWEKQVCDILMQESVYSEGTVAKCCVESIDEGGELFIGNSMPIRDVDMFSLTSSKKIHIYSNRGASGIDGIISSALGMCNNSNNKNSLLLIGDVSFYHDMNGLLASRYGANLTIVVINNSGGGIFSFLPIANSGLENFQQYWTTDTDLKINKVADLYNCKYYFAENLNEVKKSIRESFKYKGVQIIEVKTSISKNISAHKRMSEKVKLALI